MSRARRIDGTVEERFWPKVDKSGDCWTWTAYVDELSGYGRFQTGENSGYAHRVSYELTHGAIPDGMKIDHICRNRACVNPNHLRVATTKQNSENLSRSSRNSSGHRGVTWHRPRNNWVVQVRHNYKMHNGGYFANLDEAVAAATALRLSLFTHNDSDRKAA